MPKQSLVLIAFRSDIDHIKQRMEAILAAGSSMSADTQAVVHAKAVDELVANDLDRLASIVGWEGVRSLNVGDVVAETDVR